MDDYELTVGCTGMPEGFDQEAWDRMATRNTQALDQLMAHVRDGQEAEVTFRVIGTFDSVGEFFESFCH